MKPRPFLRKTPRFLSAHPLQALLEMWLLGLLLLFALSRLAGAIDPAALGNGTLLLCGLCGMWAVLRTRVPERTTWVQVLLELGVAAAVSLVMVVGLGLLAQPLGWDVAWVQSTMGEGVASLLLFLTGPGYLVARVGVRLWLFWNRLRRQRMLWSLTHAHLVVALIVMLLALAGFLSSAIALTAGRESEPLDPAASFATRLLHTVFPGVSMIGVLIIIALAAMLPPSAIFSFLVARKTTRRLERLATATQALRSGNYRARVQVAGEDEVAQLQSDFNAMADELERTLFDLQAQRDTVARLLQSRRELVANVSHELRTPVATMRALLESSLAHGEDTPPPALRHDLEVMQGEVRRLQTLIDDLFALSQAEVDHLALDCRPTDVGPVVQQMVDAIAPLAWQSGRVQVIAELPATLPQARVDRARLEQILANLLRNGVRHTPPGGIVVATASAEGQAVRIEVRDTGEGIAPQDLPHIWERFYRGASANVQDQRGAGLGLALVKELTEAIGGSVAVESKVGQGSCFVIRLPKVET